MKFIGQGAQTFGQHANAADMYRQLAGFGFEQMTFSTHDVAQVPMLEVVVNIGTNLFALHIHLHPSCAVLQGGKTGFAHDAFQDHATSDAHRMFFCEQSLCVLAAMRGVQSISVVRRFEIVGESHRTAKGLASSHGAQFLTAFCDELVFVLVFGGGCVFGHPRILRVRRQCKLSKQNTLKHHERHAHPPRTP